jgi:membrane associated rhomboid family serine protease
LIRNLLKSYGVEVSWQATADIVANHQTQVRDNNAKKDGLRTCQQNNLSPLGRVEPRSSRFLTGNIRYATMVSMKAVLARNRVLITTLILPLFIAAVLPSVLGMVGSLMEFVAWLLPFAFIVKVFSDSLERTEHPIIALWNNIMLLPLSLKGSSLSRASLPPVTSALVAVNILVFLVVPEETVGKYMFYPTGDPGGLQVMISIFTKAFLHANFNHLFGNMAFLWVLGGPVEKRMGSLQFLGVYFFFIVASTILTLFNLFLINGFDFLTALPNYHSLGASGAVSGILGLFAIRCSFADIRMAIPIPPLYLIQLPLRVPVLFFSAFFFTWNLVDGFDQVGDRIAGREYSHIGYWAHIGGYLGGVLMAYWLRLNRDAEGESLIHRAKKVSRRPWQWQEAEEAHLQVLANDPDNLESLLFFFHKYRNREKGGPYFVKLMAHYARSDFNHAAVLYEETYPRFNLLLTQKMLVLLGRHFTDRGKTMLAFSCLEDAVDRGKEWTPRALLDLAEAYDRADAVPACIKTLHRLATDYPEDSFGLEAQRRLRIIQQTHSTGDPSQVNL